MQPCGTPNAEESMYEDKIYLTVNETAEYVRTTADTIYRWNKDPDHPLRATRLSANGPLLFNKKDLDRILEENKFPEVDKAKKELDIHDHRTD
jgi:hypothetical protein